MNYRNLKNTLEKLGVIKISDQQASYILKDAKQRWEEMKNNPYAFQLHEDEYFSFLMDEIKGADEDSPKVYQDLYISWYKTLV